MITEAFKKMKRLQFVEPTKADVYDELYANVEEIFGEGYGLI